MTSLVVFVERIDNSWFSEKVIFSERTMLNNGAEFFNRNIIHIEMSNEAEEEMLLSQRT